MKNYLLRAWGRDVAKLQTLHPDALDDGCLCWWFDTAEERDEFKAAASGLGLVVFAERDEGVDEDGEMIYTHKVTRAYVTLRLPDGTEASYVHAFGYGYPASSVEYAYHDGNYSCDCNRRLFLARYAGIGEDAIDAVTCGDTIALVSLDVVKGEPS